MNKENLIDLWTANVKEIYDDDSRTDTPVEAHCEGPSILKVDVEGAL